MELTEFRKKNFADQIRTVNSIGENKKTEEIPSLFELLENPVGDPPVDNIIEEVLRNLISISPDLCIEKINSDNDKIRLFCIKTVRRYKIAKAAEPLKKTINTCKDEKVTSEALISLSAIADEDSIEIFRGLILNPDPILSSLAIETIGRLNDYESKDKLFKIIEESEKKNNFHKCSVATAKAIEILYNIQSDETIEFLASKIHHMNPTARRIIHEKLILTGQRSLNYLEKAFEDNDPDHQIMAANIIGSIAHKKGCNILIDAIDRGMIQDENVQYAVYEAFGKIKSIKSMVFLTDALTTDSQMILMSVITSLNQMAHPGVKQKIEDIIREGGQSADRLLDTIVATGAGNIFSILYSDKKIRHMLMERILKTNDQALFDEFRTALEKLGDPDSAEDIKTLAEMEELKTELSILAADDSKAMLMFYRSLSSDLGFNVHTAENGKQAYELLMQEGMTINFIITDLNMPVMDGLEFTEKVRNNMLFSKVPVIMATTEKDSSQIELAKKAGVTDFITKPFTADEFLMKLKDM